MKVVAIHQVQRLCLHRGSSQRDACDVDRNHPPYLRSLYLGPHKPTHAQVRYPLRRSIYCDGLGWFAGGLIVHRLPAAAPVVRMMFTLRFMALRMRCRYSHALPPRAFTPWAT